MPTQTKKLTTLAMLCALAYLVMVFGRIPVISFPFLNLKYDPKDVIIVIGGFLYGPLSALAISVVVSVIEMLTVSETGVIGLVMNVISSCAFACTASLMYKYKRTQAGAVYGLIAAWLLAAAVMLLWNYIIVPLYMPGITREAVAGLLLPAFLPYNLIKGGLNAGITMLLYKPVTLALRKAGLMKAESVGAGRRINPLVIGASAFVVITCVLLILIYQGIL